MKIDFYLRFSTKFGQQLSITGNAFSLGNGELDKALPMTFLNHEFWHASIEIMPSDMATLHYQYVFTTEKGEQVKEGEKNRFIELNTSSKEHVTVIDTWNHAGEFENAFYTTPFKDIFLKRKHVKYKKAKEYTHIFKVKAPLLSAEESICMVDEAGNWDSESPYVLQKDGDWWTIARNLDSPLIYKYGVYNHKKETFIRFENGDNRFVPFNAGKEGLTLIHDGFVHLPNNTWKGAGVAIPVFALRSSNSFGVGEFLDIKLLADWAAKVGLRMIQVLPVNDTSATFTNQDSYPYAAISAFALHPIYINLEKLAGKEHAHVVKALSKKQKQLNSLEDVDYAKVMQFKMQVLRELHELKGNKFMQEDEFLDFFKDNRQWLKPYAAFCHFRDKYGTADFTQWKTNAEYNEEDIDKIASSKGKGATEIKFYYFIQYHLHLQLSEAAEFAHKKGLALKGDIPIGIFRNSVDAWTQPGLYHMDWQAGAPPDDFAVKGQNWGFPTYNWKRMQENHFEWWQQRFHQMSNYFDAFRIDHILGFFRIWSIPVEAVEGIMGRFVPALPIHISEFGEKAIWFDYDRYCLPYITDAVLDQIFGTHVSFVKDAFLVPNSRNGYDLKEEFNTQKKIESWFHNQDQDSDNETLKKGLFDLVSNVLFFEHTGSEKKAFHFRIAIDQTTSYHHLDDHTKGKLWELYIDYFYRRQDDFWKEEAMHKLPYLKEATEMLICGEDLGMVPHCVPEVMSDLGILSLEIQRMPKNQNTEFFHPKDAPYLSVITPSTHDMSTVRGWWEENRDRTQKFYNTVLDLQGAAPLQCESWISRAIILQHLYSPAMWVIFQLQDLLAMNDPLRRKDINAERINQPADPKHFWKYRMHISLEQLLKEKDFNNELNDYITNSGRN